MRIEQSEFHDHLLRGLTHKMNNILSLFHGYLGLLMDDKKLDPETVAGLVRIRDGATAASRLMDRTKALSTPSSVWRQIAPDDFLRALVPACNGYAAHGVQIQFSCEAGLPYFWVDASGLRIALKEIVKNACEASPADGIVQIAIKRYARPVRTQGRCSISSPIGWMSISVTDFGKGIPADLNSKIFQPFFTTKNKRDSLGLGLSVALGLAQRLGGTIRIQSRPGKTTVRLLLPARARSVEPAAKIAA